MTKEEFVEQYKHRRKFLEWSRGGASGGSCWGDEAEPFDSETEPEIDSVLRKFLSLFCSNVSDAEYEAIRYSPGIEVSRDWTDWEYYGNYNDRSHKTVNLDAVWPFIKLIIDVSDSSVRKAHYILMED